VKSKLRIVLAGALALTSVCTYAQETIGVVKRSQGHVVVERAGVPIALKQGTEVQRGDRLVTGADGYASINMRRAAVISVGPHTEFALDRFAAEDKPVASRAAPRILQSLASFLAVNRQR
jgi:hypothetical protein